MKGGACLLLGLLACTRREPERSPEPAVVAGPTGAAALPSPAPASYVGSERCKDCHAQAYLEWRGSQHQRAMQVPTAESVLGDFANRDFARRGERTRFSQEGAAYRLETLGVSRAAGVTTVHRRRF